MYIVQKGTPFWAALLGRTKFKKSLKLKDKHILVMVDYKLTIIVNQI